MLTATSRMSLFSPFCVSNALRIGGTKKILGPISFSEDAQPRTFVGIKFYINDGTNDLMNLAM